MLIILATVNIFGKDISAVWVLPWSLKSPSMIDSLLATLQKNGQNTILAEVRYRADAIYKPNKVDSTYVNNETVSHYFSDRDFDALGYLCKVAPKYKIAVHAWMTTYVITSRDLSKLPHNHIYYTHKDWITTDINGNLMDKANLEGYYFDPGIPEVQDYILNIVCDIVKNYPQLAGIQLDYFRYPNQKYGYHPKSISEFDKLNIPRSYENLQKWRVKQITDMLELIYCKSKAINPDIEVSVASISDRDKGYNKYSQNWLNWLDEGMVDRVYLMAYSKKNSDIEKLVKDKSLAKHKEKIVIGLRAWNNSKKRYSVNKICEKIKIARMNGYRNIALFSYNGIAERNYWKGLSKEYIK